MNELLEHVNAQFDDLCTLRLQPEDLAYLRSFRFIKSDCVDFLRIFELKREFIKATVDGPTLAIKAVGPPVHTMTSRSSYWPSSTNSTFAAWRKAPHTTRR